MARAIHLLAFMVLVGCSSTRSFDTNSVIRGYLEDMANNPTCLTSEPWWCRGGTERPQDLRMKPCTQLVVARQTTPNQLGPEQFSEWPLEAVADLWQQKHSSVDLKITHTAHLPVKMVDSDEVQALDPCSFYSQFPGAPPLLEFSNVGFSSDRRSAVFIVSKSGSTGGSVAFLARPSHQ